MDPVLWNMLAALAFVLLVIGGVLAVAVVIVGSRADRSTKRAVRRHLGGGGR